MVMVYDTTQKETIATILFDEERLVDVLHECVLKKVPLWHNFIVSSDACKQQEIWKLHLQLYNSPWTLYVNNINYMYMYVQNCGIPWHAPLSYSYFHLLCIS